MQDYQMFFDANEDGEARTFFKLDPSPTVSILWGVGPVFVLGFNWISILDKLYMFNMWPHISACTFLPFQELKGEYTC